MVAVADTEKQVKCPFVPFADNVVIVPRKVKSIGNIALPDNSTEVLQEGEVVAVGPGLWSGTGYAPMECEVGDVVMLCADRPFDPISENGENYLLVRQVYLRVKRA